MGGALHLGHPQRPCGHPQRTPCTRLYRGLNGYHFKLFTLSCVIGIPIKQLLLVSQLRHRGLDPESPGLEPVLFVWCYLCEEGREGTSGHGGNYRDGVDSPTTCEQALGDKSWRHSLKKLLWEPGSNPWLLSECIFCYCNTVNHSRNRFLLCARNCPRRFMFVSFTFPLTPGKLWSPCYWRGHGVREKGGDPTGSASGRGVAAGPPDHAFWVTLTCLR